MSEKKSEERRVYGRPFAKGHDPRRHKFTSEECSKGFWAAVESIVERYPDAIMSDGRHMVVNFLKNAKRAA
jgi:hypothetical protein